MPERKLFYRQKLPDLDPDSIAVSLLLVWRAQYWLRLVHRQQPLRPSCSRRSRRLDQIQALSAIVYRHRSRLNRRSTSLRLELRPKRCWLWSSWCAAKMTKEKYKPLWIKCRLTNEYPVFLFRIGHWYLKNKYSLLAKQPILAGTHS